MRTSVVLLPAVAGIALLLGCGGKDSHPTSGTVVVPAPSGLTYGENPAVYRVGRTIEANLPHLTQGAAQSWSVNPALPAGLSLEASTGAITGTPTLLAPKGGYTVTARNAAGTTTAQLILTVNPAPPVLETAPASTTLSLGQAATFKVVAKGTGSLTYQWQKNHVDLPGATAPDYRTAPVTRADDGATFRVVVTDGYGGTVTSPDAILGVLQGGLTPLADAGPARYGHLAVALKDGRVLVQGGRGDAGLVSTAELFDPATSTFGPTQGQPLQARFGATATVLADGRVLVVGGWNATGHVAQAEVFDPATGQFLAAGTLKVARSFHTATILGDGRVLITGGMTVQALASAEIYEPDLVNFRPCPGSMAKARAFHTATVLPDGKVLVAGGRGTTGPVPETELFDPVSEAFQRGPALVDARYLHTATRLPDGGVMLAGGLGAQGTLATVERFQNGALKLFGTLAVGRQLHQATLLRDGSLLLSGGWTGKEPLGSFELLDPVKGIFMPVSGAASGFHSHSATLLPDGRVLIRAGFASAPLATGSCWRR